MPWLSFVLSGLLSLIPLPTSELSLLALLWCVKGGGGGAFSSVVSFKTHM